VDRVTSTPVKINVVQKRASSDATGLSPTEMYTGLVWAKDCTSFTGRDQGPKARTAIHELFASGISFSMLVSSFPAGLEITGFPLTTISSFSRSTRVRTVAFARTLCAELAGKWTGRACN
jgi:hypothetical protein